MASLSRPPITCHVLDTLSGTPAPSIAVTLQLLAASGHNSSDAVSFSGTTNADGRVAAWSAAGGASLEEAFAGATGDMQWVIKFDTGSYWAARGVTPFFPEVDIRFVTQGFKGKSASELEGKSAHWHVPLLLGPYSYTTYRGS